MDMICHSDRIRRWGCFGAGVQKKSSHRGSDSAWGWGAKFDSDEMTNTNALSIWQTGRVNSSHWPGRIRDPFAHPCHAI